MLKEQIDPDFIEGFVKQCMDAGLGLESTENLFRRHTFNYFISSPNVFQGFQEKIASCKTLVKQSTLTRLLTPEVIALAAECRVKYGSDALSEQIRQDLGLPDPSWDTVPEVLQKIASSLNGVVDRFDMMPLNQKIFLASLVGSGIGGMNRVMRPTMEDQYQNHGTFSRFSRGAIRGGATGAGAAAGASAGSSLAGGIDPGLRMPGMVMGGVAGALGARRLASDVVS